MESPALEVCGGGSNSAPNQTTARVRRRHDDESQCHPHGDGREQSHLHQDRNGACRHAIGRCELWLTTLGLKTFDAGSRRIRRRLRLRSSRKSIAAPGSLRNRSRPAGPGSRAIPATCRRGSRSGGRCSNWGSSTRRSENSSSVLKSAPGKSRRDPRSRRDASRTRFAERSAHVLQGGPRPRAQRSRIWTRRSPI